VIRASKDLEYILEAYLGGQGKVMAGLHDEINQAVPLAAVVIG
jgi:hypothetical protein